MVYGTLGLEAHLHPCFSHGFDCSASLVIKRIITISDVEAEGIWRKYYFSVKWKSKPDLIIRQDKSPHLRNYA